MLAFRFLISSHSYSQSVFIRCLNTMIITVSRMIPSQSSFMPSRFTVKSYERCVRTVPISEISSRFPSRFDSLCGRILHFRRRSGWVFVLEYTKIRGGTKPQNLLDCSLFFVRMMPKDVHKLEPAMFSPQFPSFLIVAHFVWLIVSSTPPVHSSEPHNIHEGNLFFLRVNSCPSLCFGQNFSKSMRKTTNSIVSAESAPKRSQTLIFPSEITFREARRWNWPIHLL